MEQIPDEDCRICNQSLRKANVPSSRVTKGLRTLVRHSQRYCDNLFADETSPAYLHVRCRKKYTHEPTNKCSDESEVEVTCRICSKSIQDTERPTSRVLAKGLSSLQIASKRKHDGLFALDESYPLHLHDKCRKRYVRDKDHDDKENVSDEGMPGNAGGGDAVEACRICMENLHVLGKPVVQVGAKGLVSLVKSSKWKHDGLFAVDDNVPLHLHKECRLNYVRRYDDDDEGSKLNEVNFDPHEHCLFCGEEATKETKRGRERRKQVSEITSDEMVKKVLNRAQERNDQLGSIVTARLQQFRVHQPKTNSFLVTYHNACKLSLFLHNPLVDDETTDQAEEKETAFERLFDFITSNADRQFSLSQLQEKMEEFQPVSKKWLKDRIEKRFGAEVMFTDVPGRHTVVTVRRTANKILYDNWLSGLTAEDKRQDVVREAAQVVREDIASFESNDKEYPASTSFDASNQAVPHSLMAFVRGVVVPCSATENATQQRNVTAITQAVMSAARPRSFVSLLLLAVGVFIHRRYGSRELITLLHNLGFSESYAEVVKYENCLLLHKAKADVVPEDLEGSSVQYAFDNADWNAATIDGHHTFHAMGGIRVTTPAPRRREDCVPRTKTSTADMKGAFAQIPVLAYRRQATPALKTVTVRQLSMTPNGVDDAVQSARKLDTLWMLGATLTISPRPSWGGFNDRSTENVFEYDVSQVDPLPFINLDPTNLTTIFSAITFAREQCSKQGKRHCILTFDEPLFAKASEIVASSFGPGEVVLRLGGFHCLMSYFGSVGHVMSGSGLEELWGTVYAPASVPHMISGKAYARALRAHTLTQQALVSHIVAEQDSFLEEGDDTALRTLYQELMATVQDSETIQDNACLTAVTARLMSLLAPSSTTSRTLKLWLSYLECVQIMKDFIRAERTGTWELHLHSIRSMLPLFHSTGHLAYAKYAHLYVQNMEDLKTSMDQEEYELFSRSHFTVRRSQKYWCGVWSDLTIEHTLMRAMKSSGGLTRGRGLAETTLTRWINALPLTLPICNALEQFAGTLNDAEEHVDLRASRQTRDQHDTGVFQDWFGQHSPLEGRPDHQLVSLSTGIVGDDSVNPDTAISIGQESQLRMIGLGFADVRLQRKSKVNPLAAMKNTVNIRGTPAVAQPQQMLNRALSVLESSTELQSYLKYELVPQPPALFDDVSLRKPAKAAISTLFFSFTSETNVPSSPDVFRVLDGGNLLHKVFWPKPAIYNDVCSCYVDYVTRHFGQQTTVVFDGYADQSSTKKAEQRRREAAHTSADIELRGSLATTVPQANFLGNASNKEALIVLLSEHLQAAGISTLTARSDADSLIVSTAIAKAKDHTVVVVGNDADLLVLLLVRAPPLSKIFLLQEAGKAQPKVFDISKTRDTPQIKDMTDSLLFWHAMSGSDTTSAPYKKGKKTAFSLLKKNATLRQQVQVFNKRKASKEEIADVGEKFLRCLYSNDKATEETLDALRFSKFKKENAKKKPTSIFQMASLPPTSAAARQHSFRVYLQVQAWLGNHLSPTEWGWTRFHSNLVPFPTDLASAPEKLLRSISCNCKAGCTGRCSCRKASMPCSPLCGCVAHCCTNTVDLPEIEEEAPSTV